MKKEEKSRQPLPPGVRKKEAGGQHKWRPNGTSVQEVSEFQNLQESRKEHDCGDGTCRLCFESLGTIRSSEWKTQVATLCHRLTGPVSGRVDLAAEPERGQPPLYPPVFLGHTLFSDSEAPEDELPWETEELDTSMELETARRSNPKKALKCLDLSSAGIKP